LLKFLTTRKGTHETRNDATNETRVDKVQLTGISLLSAANEKREREGARMRSKDDEWRRRRHKGGTEVLEDVLREVGGDFAEAF